MGIISYEFILLIKLKVFIQLLILTSYLSSII